MNIRDLKYLVAIADYGNFGKAAEACFVSQPALSMQIRKLEEELGVLLIERTNKRIFFTETGTLAVQQAREVLHRFEAMKALISQAKDPFSGELHLGIIPTLAPYLLPTIMPELSVFFPKLRIYLVEDTTLNLLKRVTEGKLDAALLAIPVEGDFTVHRLFDEEFFVALPQNHPMAHQKTVSLADLSDKTLLLLEDGHCLRDQALTLCNIAQATEFKNFRATSLETLRHMVASGLGITLMPRLACHSNDGICYIPFESPAPMRTIGMIWRESSAKTRLLESMIKQLKAGYTSRVAL